MVKYIYTLSLLALSLTACRGQGAADPSATVPLPIGRFDKALFRLIDSGDTTLFDPLRREYPAMLELLGKGVLNMQSPDQPGFREKLMRFYSEPTLKQLYRDAIARYDTVADLEETLGRGFAYLHSQFKEMPQPALYMHVSGFNQNLLAGDSLLSLSIDKYLGKGYPLYDTFFYDYQQQTMQRENVVPDYLAGWLMSEYPFEGNENVLLERMIYEGKIKYVLSRALPELSPAVWMGYTPEQLAWAEANEAAVWHALIERKHLYTPDHATTARYFDPAPASFLADEAPGNLGCWIGYRIICRYMEESSTTPETLMRLSDAQEILTRAKYKP